MKIKRIELYNFRQYKDKQVIDFSCDDTKNVTILIGENTSGKAFAHWARASLPLTCLTVLPSHPASAGKTTRPQAA